MKRETTQRHTKRLAHIMQKDSYMHLPLDAALHSKTLHSRVNTCFPIISHENRKKNITVGLQLPGLPFATDRIRIKERMHASEIKTETTQENLLDQLLLLPSSTAGNVYSSSSKLEAFRTALESRVITSDDFLFLQKEQDIRSFIQRHDLVDVQNDVKRIIQERLSFFFFPTVSRLTLPVSKKTEVLTKSAAVDSRIVEGIPVSPPISYPISGLHSCQADVYYRCTILRTKEVVTTSYRFYLDSMTSLQACTISTTSVSHSKKAVTNTNTNTTGTKKTLWFAAKKMKAGGGGLLFFQLEHTKDWVEKNAIGKVSAGE